MRGSVLLVCAGLSLALAAGAPTAHAAWPGANGEILFSSGGDLQTTPGPGAAWRAVTSDPGDDAQGAWSPDGTRIAFRAGPEGDREVYVQNADGSARRRLTDTPPPGTFSTQPSWSPDGRRLLFRSDRDGDPDVWSMSAADGGDVRQETNLPGDERYPAYAPDGGRIVLRNDMDGDPEIFTLAVTTGELRRLTDNAIFDSAPSWSPDGARIAFERSPANGREAPSPAGPGDVYVMRSDGSDLRRLTADPAHDEGPAWAPDGTRLLFTSERTGNSDIWMMAPDGSGPQPVTTAPTLEESPDWRPIPRCVPTAAGAVRVSTLAARGLRVGLACAPGLAVRARLTVTAAQARRAHLELRTLAAGARPAGGTATTLRLRTRARTARRLRRVPARMLRALTVRLTVTTAGPAGRAIATRPVRLAPAG